MRSNVQAATYDTLVVTVFACPDQVQSGRRGAVSRLRAYMRGRGVGQGASGTRGVGQIGKHVRVHESH